MGCESARVTVEQSLQGTDCKVLLAMDLTGIVNSTVKFEFPLTVKLENKSLVSANEQR